MFSFYCSPDITLFFSSSWPPDVKPPVFSSPVGKKLKLRLAKPTPASFKKPTPAIFKYALLLFHQPTEPSLQHAKPTATSLVKLVHTKLPHTQHPIYRRSSQNTKHESTHVPSQQIRMNHQTATTTNQKARSLQNSTLCHKMLVQVKGQFSRPYTLNLAHATRVNKSLPKLSRVSRNLFTTKYTGVTPERGRGLHGVESRRK